MEVWTDSISIETELLLEACVAALAKEAYQPKQLDHARMLNLVDRLNGFQNDQILAASRLLDAYTLHHGGRTIRWAVYEHRQEMLRATRYTVSPVVHASLCQLCLLDLPRPLGRTLIRPETLGDKVSDLFSRQDLDFPFHPEFSRRYYLLTDQPVQVSQTANRPFLDAMMDWRDLVVETDGHALLLTRPVMLTSTDAPRIAATGFRLLQSL